MNFEVYCDESGQEALTDKEAHAFIAIGGIWMPAEYRGTFKDSMKSIKEKYSVIGELKWKKVSPKFELLYKDVVDYFFSTDQLRFRVILVESRRVDNFFFNNKDAELGFYKFYYQLLHHWIYDNNNYSFFLDHKQNRDKGRLKELQSCLRNANITSVIDSVQATPSHESLAIQLADVLIGAVAGKFNESVSSKAKLQVIESIENNLGHSIRPTHKNAEKFNVFQIDLRGGW